MTPLPLAPTAATDPFGGEAAPVRTGESGRILRLKIGYNPNSSSIGTIVFGMPAALAVFTVAFGTAAGVLCAALLRTRASRRPPVPGSAPSEPPAAAQAADDAAPSTLEAESAGQDSKP